jgi:hypothetical protein
MTYTATQIESAIEGSIDFDGWGEVKYNGNGDKVLDITLDGETVPVTKVDSFGGEGMGEEIWVVVQVGDQYFEKDGYYASHYGTDWDGSFTEVSPSQKTITVYETV